jgi:tetratricopeptide (TPR) repeat protein
MDRRTAFIAGAVLLVAALIAYANSFSVPLIFDDWVTILHNPNLRKVWPIWSAFSPPEYSGVGGRPIANLSFVLNYAVTGESMAGFHAVNLAIHFLAGLTLFGIVRRTLVRIEWPDRGAHVATVLALAVAAFWTLHPVQTQSVTYVSQRTEVLMGCFYFLTLYCFIRATESGATWRWPVLTTAACLAGMATKEGMVTAPVMLFLYDYVFVAGSITVAWRQRWRVYLALVATWIVLPLLMGGLRGRGVGFGLGMDAATYLLIECGAVMRYLGLALWPWPLVFDYGTDLGGVGAARMVSAVGIFGIALGTLWALWRRPAIGFLGAWFLITLAPTSSVVPIPLQPISENRVYVPLAAVVAGLVFWIATAIGRRDSRPVFTSAAFALVALTIARNRDYRSEVSIWADTVAKRPDSARAHNNLGHVLQAAGRLPEARAEHETALRLRPGYADAHLNLASVLGRLGMVDGALEHSHRAVQLEPQNANAHYNLGVAYREKGNVEAAIAAFEATLRVRPEFTEARNNVAILLLQTGKPAAAIAHSEAALRTNPNSIDARYNLACGLSMVGRSAEAAPLFQEVARVRPTRPDVQLNLGITLQQLGRVTEASDAYQALLRLDPNHAVAHFNLGNILLTTGKTAEALNHYEAALRSNPNFSDAHANLGVALATLGRAPEAIAHLNTALQLNPNSVVARQALEKVRAAAGSGGSPPK